MSIYTEADKHLNVAAVASQKALTALSNVAIHECEGSDDYKEEVSVEILKAFNYLFEARVILKKVTGE